MLAGGRERLVGVPEQEKSFTVLLRELRVHIDANEDSDEWDFLKVRSEGEIAGSAEITNQGVEAFDLGIVSEDARKLFEERVVALVGEETGGHGVRWLIAAGGGALTGQQHRAVPPQRHLPGNRSRYGSGPHDGWVGRGWTGRRGIARKKQPDW